MKQDAESNAAKEAADKIEAAKTKIFGVQAAKAALENKEGDILREQLATMQEQYTTKKTTMGEEAYKQAVLAILLKLLQARKVLETDSIRDHVSHAKGRDIDERSICNHE